MMNASGEVHQLLGNILAKVIAQSERIERDRKAAAPVGVQLEEGRRDEDLVVVCHCGPQARHVARMHGSENHSHPLDLYFGHP